MTTRVHALAALAIAVGLAGLVTAQGPAYDFKPDTTFTGSALTGWKTVGAAQWSAVNGELNGAAAAGGAGGWLVLDKSYQDLNFFSRFRCAGDCKMGVLFRMEKTATGMKGVYVSLTPGDLVVYKMTLDADGKELTREAAAGASAFIRTAPAPGGRGRGLIAGAGRAGNRDMKLPTPLPELQQPVTGYKANDWNAISIVLDSDIIRPTLNQGFDIQHAATDDSSQGYGQIALYVGGTGKVTYKDVSFQDLRTRVIAPERVGARFRKQQLDEFYYAWGAAAADFNRDGVLDVVAGPYIYLGPDYTKRQEMYITQPFNPASAFSNSMVDYAFDFTGDGFPDVIAGEGRPMALYVNPGASNRRWQRFAVLPQITTELALMRDLDNDGTPEIIFGMGAPGAGPIVYAKPVAGNPTAPWVVHPISAPEVQYGHGMGVGDVNSDGRMDILQAAGWWEQPPAGQNQGLWIYHPVAFGRWGRPEGAGGADMAVYDVNGDKLNDVVTGLNAHGFGLAWFEQKKSASGEISFTRHMIIDDFSTKNAGNVTMTEMHASAMADVDGDGIQDYITGKRYWSHLDSHTDPDAYGEPVLYWFRTVRNKNAPGGAEFVPELIHNKSGVGSQFTAIDLNKDGAVDIVTSTTRGTFIFWGTRGARGAASPAPASRGATAARGQ
jgi:hypothetical protein